MAREWTAAQEKLVKPPGKLSPLPLVPPNCAMVCSDAAWRASSQRAGLGWIIKKQETIASSFSTVSAVGSALVAESMALRQAIKESHILGIKRLVCKSDSAQLIKALNGGEVPLELYGIVADILDLSFLFEVLSFRWISRDKNKDADLLAKEGLVVVEALMANT